MVESESDLGRGGGLAVEGHRAPHRERARISRPDQGDGDSGDPGRRLCQIVVERQGRVRRLGSAADVASLGERHHRADPLAPRPSPDWLLVDAGDDAAVVRAARGTVVEVITTDAVVDGVHVDRALRAARRRSATARSPSTLSDLAAMGATPRLATLSLALPSDFPTDDLDARC